MKKFTIIALAAVLVVALTVPAMALENIFGGYFRLRAVHQEDFFGEEVAGDSGNASWVDQRTRLYYTAKFSDNFQFVNKFEFDTAWGLQGSDSFGDIGADGVRVEVKNTYVDFSMDMLNFKLGTQGGRLGRSFLFDDDFSGAVVTYNGDPVTIPFYWMKQTEGGNNNNSADSDYYAIAPMFNMDVFKLQPYFMWVTSDNAGGNLENSDLYFLGVDVDGSFDMFNAWLTFIYEAGTIEQTVGDDLDVSAYLAAVGASMDMGPFGLHGQFFWATGDDDPNDSDLEAFVAPQGQSYYWSEIMGLGTFDSNTSLGNAPIGPQDRITNIMAGNVGASMSPMEDLKLTLDLWYAALVEDDANGEDTLGYEVDLKMDYKLMDNLNLTAIGAYLFADDAYSLTGKNDDNPWEVGTQLSLSF